MHLRHIFFILLLGLSNKIVAQQSVLNNASSTAIATYYKSLAEQAPIYNGAEYLESPIILQEGHVFFQTNVFVKGTIGFDSMIFTDVPLLYDILKDQVIVQHFTQFYKISLSPEKVDYFTFPGHYFVHLAADPSGTIKDGFYESLYSGKTMLFAKRIKKISEEHNNFQINSIVIQSSKYYIKKEGIYYQINKLSTLLNIFKKNKKEIQQSLSKNKIKFKSDPESAMIMALEYYDQSTN